VGAHAGDPSYRLRLLFHSFLQRSKLPPRRGMSDFAPCARAIPPVSTLVSRVMRLCERLRWQMRHVTIRCRGDGLNGLF